VIGDQVPVKLERGKVVEEIIEKLGVSIVGLSFTGGIVRWLRLPRI